jgi:hypothetical protein
MTDLRKTLYVVVRIREQKPNFANVCFQNGSTHVHVPYVHTSFLEINVGGDVQCDETCIISSDPDPEISTLSREVVAFRFGFGFGRDPPPPPPLSSQPSSTVTTSTDLLDWYLYIYVP